MSDVHVFRNCFHELYLLRAFCLNLKIRKKIEEYFCEKNGLLLSNLKHNILFSTTGLSENKDIF